MRFDDSLATVLAADSGSVVGAAAAWRQLCDLVGRRRVPDVDAAIARLRDLRARVPAAVRGASGRALIWAEPPAALVALFAEDDLPIAAPVLRTARLNAPDWLALLPALSPAARSVLRHRRDLPGEVMRGLDSFGSTDFVLGHDALPVAPPVTATPALPLPAQHVAPVPAPAPVVEPTSPGFEIADVMARIDAFRRDRPVEPATLSLARADLFQFHTDAGGTVRWIEGVARTPLVGLRLATDARQGLARLDKRVAVARREAFRDVTLRVTGDTSAAGSWRLAGEPRFDGAAGRFTGYGGIGRRVADAVPPSSASDTLRQLVHELRTPANAMSGFAELIGTELLGPVPPVYRERAELILRQSSGLTGAIDDLDAAARLEGDALDLRPCPVDLVPLLTQALAALAPLATARGVVLTTHMPPHAEGLGDLRAVHALVDRLLAVAVSAAEPGERIHAQLVTKLRSIRLHVTRPRALAAVDDAALLAIDADQGGDDALPLGVGFTLRLVRGLAAASGGSLTIAADRLTLRLPAPVTAAMEQAAAQ